MTKGERDTGAKSALNYFSVLGVSEDAGQDDLEQRYRELADYLASPAVPAGLRDWAKTQAALVDEAYAVLADPESRAAARQRTGEAPATAEAPPAAAPAAPPAVPSPRVRSGAGARAAASPRRGGPGLSLWQSLRAQPLLLGAIVGLVVLVAVPVGRSGIPGTGGSDSVPPAQTASDLVPLDTARIAELMQVIKADPKNADALFELGESYFLAGEWQQGIDWFTELLTVDANNVHARTDIGTANFNLNRIPEAKASWTAALAIDPNDIQLHYNMGFLYANAEPQDLVAARQEWQKVVDLAPDSNLAKTAKVHLNGMPTATPAGAAAATSTAVP